MAAEIILASASPIRRKLLEDAGLSVSIAHARVDEAAIRASLVAEAAKPRDIADTLAEYKARKISGRNPDALVIGADQVLELNGRILEKPGSPEGVRAQLTALSGRIHALHSAAVVYENARPVWRHVSTVRLTMRRLSDEYLGGYIAREGEVVSGCVGGYRLEGEGVRLFSRIDGDYFAVLGLPLVELLGFLSARGSIPA